jgi:undecaprenyl-diphosphatase
MLLAGERLRRRTPANTAVGAAAKSSDRGPVTTLTLQDSDVDSDHRLAQIPWRSGILVGCSQVLALLPGISRSGASMVAGLTQGLSHRDAARFSFLLATPVILAAGALKVPDLFGSLGDGIRGQILAGSLASFIAAYLSVRFLEKYFRTKTLIPFAIYSLVVATIAMITLAVR